MQSNIVQKHWDGYGAKQPKQWLHNIFVRKQVLLNPLGWNKGLDWLNWLRASYFKKPCKNVLSICCGSGHHERRLAQIGLAKNIEGVDISEGQLRRARENAVEEGYHNITYTQADIQQCNLEPQKYDMVISVAALHHLNNLPFVMKQLHKALKDDGIFVISEYVGPDHMDYTPWERQLIQKALDQIPERYRLRSSNGKILRRAGHQTIEQAINRDPSEGVKSSEILENLYKYFYADVEVEMGHSIIRECLYDIVDNFQDKEEDCEILSNLINLDRAMRRHGLIKNHHVFGVYRPYSD